MKASTNTSIQDIKETRIVGEEGQGERHRGDGELD